ncbi:MAG TPA: glycoside hydrolase family 3 N-terminal domain-containing protein [Syntrophales bacterium]|nr:glycoside hydrolase family 3 N-terminal domain-containing protein [Syntrophales bacterium]
MSGNIAEGDGLSLDVKIGQMLMVGFRGLAVDENHPIARDIRERHLGGVVLFDYDVPDRSPVRNIASPGQLRALTASLQSLSDIPLFVAVDGEGGQVWRLKERFGFPPTFSARCLGRMNNLSKTYGYAAAMAKTLAETGINLNLAPVVDLDVNPDNPVIGKLGRSFSADPETVTENAREFVRAHHDRGLLCALKHFPGHGSSSADSHLGMADVTYTWTPAEILPYRVLAGEGFADAVMTAHVFNARLDRDEPATFSRPVVTGLLRDELGYDGVVLSDDLQMRAVSDRCGFEAAVEKAVAAGVDILLVANNSVYDEDAAARSAAVIGNLVRQGKVSVSRIDRSFERILRLKNRLK